MKNKQYELILKVQLLIGILLTLCFSLHIGHKFIFLKQESPIILCSLVVIFVFTLLQNKNHYFQVLQNHWMIFYMRKREISLEIKLWQWVQWF